MFRFYPLEDQGVETKSQIMDTIAEVLLLKSRLQWLKGLADDVMESTLQKRDEVLIDEIRQKLGLE